MPGMAARPTESTEVRSAVPTSVARKSAIFLRMDSSSGPRWRDMTATRGSRVSLTNCEAAVRQAASTASF